MFLASIPRTIRRSAPLLAAGFIFSAPDPASAAQPFPAKGAYDIFIQGQNAGSNTFTATVEKNILVIRSTTSLRKDSFSLDLESKTSVSKDSLRIIEFSYKGKKLDAISMSGSAKVSGDTVTGFIEERGNSFPSKKMIDAHYTVFFENYVAEHEILLARAFLQTGVDAASFLLFYPSNFAPTPATVLHESDVELETAKGPILCTKISITLQGGPPFFSYIDSVAKVPIYLDFPGVATEMFNREYFGDEAKPAYKQP